MERPGGAIPKLVEVPTVSSAVVFGGYGTFGLLVARELASRGLAVTIAGRDLARAEGVARALGAEHQGIAADVTCPESCRSALRGQRVAVNCAGPFDRLGATLLDACLDVGCRYADIADDRAYAALVRSRADRFRQRGLVAVYGCSSLPAISGALSLMAVQQASAVPMQVRITLFIGNSNPKGLAAIRSLVKSLGKPIRAPQGIIRGFRDREVVALPAPFGRRAVFNFESPEYDILPGLLGVGCVSVKVGFESRLATYGCALLAMLGAEYGDGMAGLLERLGGQLPRLGTSGGVVMSEVFFGDGSIRRAALVGRRNGQRMAAMPCALAAHALATTAQPAAGTWTAYELFGAEDLLSRLTAAGFQLRSSHTRGNCIQSVRQRSHQAGQRYPK
jgi:hypothetical protein